MFSFWRWPNVRSRRRGPNLNTLCLFADTIAPGKPGSLRVFISHRWSRDSRLRKQIVGALQTFSGMEIEDLSIGEESKITEVDGADVVKTRIEVAIAERIGLSDVVFVPGDIAAADASWLAMETNEAAKTKRPTVFVSKRSNRQRWNRFRRQLDRQGVPCAAS